MEENILNTETMGHISSMSLQMLPLQKALKQAKALMCVQAVIQHLFIHNSSFNMDPVTSEHLLS